MAKGYSRVCYNWFTEGHIACCAQRLYRTVHIGWVAAIRAFGGRGGWGWGETTWVKQEANLVSILVCLHFRQLFVLVLSDHHGQSTTTCSMTASRKLSIARDNFF